MQYKKFIRKGNFYKLHIVCLARVSANGPGGYAEATLSPYE